jgi:hypothetical protein
MMSFFDDFTPILASLASHHADTFSGSTHNHGTQALGSGAIKLIFVACQLTSASARTVTGVSVAGNAATEIIPLVTYSTGGDYSYMAVWAIADSVNTSGNVTVTWGQSTAGSEIAVVSLANAKSVMPADTGTDTNGTINISGLDVAPGGVVVAMASAGTGSPTFTWTGLTELYDGASGVGSWSMSMAALELAYSLNGDDLAVSAASSSGTARTIGAAVVYNT